MVVAAVVILNLEALLEDLNDTKKLTGKSVNILQISLNVWCCHTTLNRIILNRPINILQASLLGIQQAVKALPVQPDKVLIDDNHCPHLSIAATEAITKVDSKIDAIAAASILAKVTRDHDMLLMDKKWSQYGIAKYKGYPTKLHLRVLKTYGLAPVHRHYFKPMQSLL